MTKKTKKDWFTTWFDTSYYHTLYKYRDDTEAQLFMQNLSSFLQLKKDAHILDLPCGKGRHSVYLNSLGYTITGTDLSENSILYAKQFENEHLHFKVADMRKPLLNKYDAIFNLFTSFGYFTDDAIDIKILKNIKKGIINEGFFVMDFLNVEKVKNHLVKDEIKSIDGIDFYIKRKIENKFIIKEIIFFADDRQHKYTEKVKFLDEKKLKNYFKEVGFTILHTFGNYHLDTFNSKTSNRLILVAK